MSAVPASIDTDRGPPMAVPLRHFAAALWFLVAGCLLGLRAVIVPAVTLAHVHLLLVGGVCLTVMGAMTQFVPVWSGVALHSRRLATAELWLVAVGVAGFAAAIAVGETLVVPVFGATMALGVWVFAYNVGRTLHAVASRDVTESHFAAALGFFALAAVLGLALAVGVVRPVFAGVPVTRTAVVNAHATLAVFGGVLTTVFGALYQLATMFTQTELSGAERRVRRAERVSHPAGVLALAAGRLVSNAALARVGGVLLLASALGVAVVLARRLLAARTGRSPMLTHYAVVCVSLALWVGLALPAWVRAPLAASARFGAPGTSHLLGLGVVWFVVVGTLYHVLPFIVWVERYSDRLGFEDVPMVDDLYDDRGAAAEFALSLVGTGALVAGETLAGEALVAVGGTLVSLGAAVFAANLGTVVGRHGDASTVALLFGVGSGDADGSE